MAHITGNLTRQSVDIRAQARSARPRLKRLVELGEMAMRRKRYREELRRLLCTAPHMIEDIGLRQEEAHYEADKPFWRA